MENDLKKRITEDKIEIDGRTFKLTSFDPLIGNYILLKLFTMILPFGVGDALKKQMGEGTEKIPDSTSSNAKMMSKEEFIDFQRDILKHTFEILPGDTVPVVRDNNTYGIQNFNMTIALNLLIAEVAFNFNDFFSESGSILDII